MKKESIKNKSPINGIDGMLNESLLRLIYSHQ